jgi:hypothetical protein
MAEKSKSKEEIAVKAPTSTMALLSLIFGILGLTALPLIGSIAAVIMAPIAKREINESEGSLGGEGLAQAGLIMGWVGIGLSAIGLCVFAIGILFLFGSAIFFSTAEDFSLLPLLLAMI